MARSLDGEQVSVSSSKTVYARDIPYTAEPAVPFDCSGVSHGTPLVIDNGEQAGRRSGLG